MKNPTALVSLPLLAVIAFPSCEAISPAPMGSPRLEVEVAVDLDESYTRSLDVGDDFTRAVTDLVMAKADLGMRFYPVLSQQYGAGDPRPEYLMTVEIRDLHVGLDHRTVTPKEGVPFIETFVKQLDCAVSTTLEKRRDSGPELTVGRGKGEAQLQVQSKSDEDVAVALRRETPDEPELTVTHDELLRGIDKALSPALKSMVVPVDRELAFRGKSTADEQPAAPAK